MTADSPVTKGPWTTGEDQTLEKLVNKYGPAWAVIAQEIETRSADRKTASNSGPRSVLNQADD